MHCKAFVRSLLQVLIYVALISICIYAFGQNSLRKYIDDAIVITVNEEMPSFITPPGEWVKGMSNQIFYCHHFL